MSDHAMSDSAHASVSVNPHDPADAGDQEKAFLDHDYDGVRIDDNPPPTWWKWLFILTILFAPLYFFFYHNGAAGRSLADSYDRAQAALMEKQFAEIGELKVDRDTVVKFLYEDTWLQVGKAVFKSNCVSCHGKDGGGLVGPNLTDDHYKNVNDIGDMLAVLQNGANAGAMPAWKNRLSPNQLVLVTSYAASLRGTTAENPKDADGKIIPPWPGPPEAEDEASANETP